MVHRPHELAVVPAAFDHHIREPERKRSIGAGPNAQPEVCLARESDMARIDDDEFHPALQRGDRRGRVGQARIGRVVAPKDQTSAVRYVRHRPAAAAGRDASDSERVARGEAPAPAAHVQRPDEVRCAKGVHQSAQERRGIAYGGGGGRRLAEGHALGPMSLRQPSHRRRGLIQSVAPGDCLPARVRFALRPGAAQGLGQPLVAINQLRRGAALCAKRLARRMRGIGIEPCETAIFQGCDAATTGDAQAAKTRDPSHLGCAHGVFLGPSFRMILGFHSA